MSELPELLEAMAANARAADPLILGGLRLLLLTFIHTNELITAAWSKIDWKNKLWITPAERMKGKRGFRPEH